MMESCICHRRGGRALIGADAPDGRIGRRRSRATVSARAVSEEHAIAFWIEGDDGARWIAVSNTQS